MRILIPSAKVVNQELQHLGKLPAVIYPVSQKIVFDYLYEQYINAEYRIVAYENVNKITQYIGKYSHTEILKLDVLKDLGYSVFFGLKDICNEIIINFADTIVMDNTAKLVPDSFYYSEDYTSNVWTFFESDKGVLYNILDKVEVEKHTRQKLFVGVFRISHIEYFRLCLDRELSSDSGSNISSFYRALQTYSEKYPLTPVKAESWFDIGHSDQYYQSQIGVKAREFNHIRIDKDRGILTKTSEDKEKFIGEIKWYLKLPSDIEYVSPRIFSYSTSYTDPHVSMEYYAYHTIHELFLYGDLTQKQWIDIFSHIAFICKDFRRYSLRDENIKESLEDMYLNKTLRRFGLLKKDGRFSRFFSNEIIVNGVKYISLDGIICLLRSFIPEMLYDIESMNIIHGDLCFTNIMIDNNYTFVKVVDPRGKFGNYDIYGDFRYELAKLLHSVDGKYDYIIKNLYTVSYDLEKCNISYSIFERERNFNLYHLFINVFKEDIGSDLQKIELIEALLFLSMIPLHSESLEHQIVMLGTGLEILDRVLDIKAK